MKLFASILVGLLLESIVLGFSSRPTFASKPSTSSLEAATLLDGQKIAGEVKPLNNFVLIKIAEAVEQTDGGILLTGKAKIQKTEGTVMAVGPGRTHADSGITIDMPVQVGEGVVYGKYDGTEIKLDGERHTLIRDDDILIKFKGELSLETVETVGDNVLVVVDTSEKETEGGILIAKSSKSEVKPSTGEIVKIGPGRVASNGELMAMDVAIGDMVKFRDFAGNEVDIDEKEYRVVRMPDILAKF